MSSESAANNAANLSHALDFLGQVIEARCAITIRHDEDAPEKPAAASLLSGWI